MTVNIIKLICFFSWQRLSLDSTIFLFSSYFLAVFLHITGWFFHFWKETLSFTRLENFCPSYQVSPSLGFICSPEAIRMVGSESLVRSSRSVRVYLGSRITRHLGSRIHRHFQYNHVSSSWEASQKGCGEGYQHSVFGFIHLQPCSSTLLLNVCLTLHQPLGTHSPLLKSDCSKHPPAVHLTSKL